MKNFLIVFLKGTLTVIFDPLLILSVVIYKILMSGWIISGLEPSNAFLISFSLVIILGTLEAFLDILGKFTLSKEEWLKMVSSDPRSFYESRYQATLALWFLAIMVFFIIQSETNIDYSFGWVNFAVYPISFWIAKKYIVQAIRLNQS